MNSEKIKKPIVGNVKFVLHKGGSFDVKKQEFTPDTKIISVKEEKNLIVNVASVLLCRRMYPGDDLVDGFQYLAVGTGYGTGTPLEPEAENSTYTTLRNEISRKVFTSTAYLNTTGEVVPTYTNIQQLTTTFLEHEANGSIVEMGLFGGNATSTPDTGYMFNYKVFAAIPKDNNTRLTLIWSISF